MNERIKELAIEAGYMEDSFGIGHWDMPECKNFAELIVRECAKVAGDFEYARLHDSLVEDKVLEHFGITND